MSATKRNPVVRAPHFPLYSELAHTVRLLDGAATRTVRGMIDAIREQAGTPQSPVNWSDPDHWIDMRLTGEHRVLARRIWEGSSGVLNPRHIYGCYLMANRESLISRSGGIYALDEKGRRFLSGDTALLRELDVAEGIPKLLSLIADNPSCRRSDLVPAWSDYVKAVSLFSMPSMFIDTLRRRLANLAERGLVARQRNSYSITDIGAEWLKSMQNIRSANPCQILPPGRRAVVEAARASNEEEVKALRARLMQLAPGQFEYFVKTLLEAMEYQDVHVTRYSGDKGVDVVARVQFGITEITEVVQVKRTEGTIGRPKVDELRGALPYHKAIRGTIISLGGFARGAREGALYAGAAPITLIDGQRLLELCVKHQVGVTRRPVEVYELNDAFFRSALPDRQSRFHTGGVPLAASTSPAR